MELVNVIQGLAIQSTVLSAELTMNEITQDTASVIEPVNAAVATGIALLAAVLIYIGRHWEK